MNKKLSLRLALKMFGNAGLLKAISMLLLVRKRLGTNVVKHYSINKLVGITGAHAHTIAKRMRVLVECGLAEMKGRAMVLRSVVSKHAERNVKLGERKVDYSSLKGVEHSLQAILVVIIQNRKDFVKRTIRNAHGASHDYKTVKAAQSAARRSGYGNEYVERGLSYKTIARRLGVCVKTAVGIIKFAEKRAILKKTTHFLSTYMKSVCKREVYGYTFTTRDYAYRVLANTYTVSPLLALV